MHAVVLVGGFGTRLRPLTNTVPKAMLPIAHVPLLVRLIGQLERGGVDTVTLALGFLPEPFVAAFPDGRCGGVRLDYAIEPEPLDTAGAIRFAADHAGIDETFVVANGDVLTDLSIADLVAAHRDAGAEATIHLIGVDDPSAFGVVERDATGRVAAVRGEAAARHRAEQPHQRRHLRVRAERAGADPARGAVLDRARHVPRHRRRRSLPLPGDRRLLDRRRAPGAVPAGEPRPRQRSPRRDRSPPSTRGPRSPPTPTVTDSVVGAGPRRVRRDGGRLGAPARRPDRARRGRRGLDRRRRRSDARRVLVRTVVGADAKIADGEHLLDARVPEPVD